MIPVDKFTSGNIVTIAIAIYKRNWKEYLKLSLMAHLWLLVPIYGWAKYFAIVVKISQIGNHRLSSDLKFDHHKNHFSFLRLVGFLSIKLTTILILNILSLLALFALIFAASEASVAINLNLNILKLINPNFIDDEVIDIFLGLIAILLYTLLFTAFYAKTFIFDPLQKKRRLFRSIKQSYVLTKKNSWRIMTVIGISFLISCQIWIIVLLVLSSIWYLLPISSVVSFLDWNAIVILWNALWIGLSSLVTMPFWQLVKAVVYYQLTSRSKIWDLH